MHSLSSRLSFARSRKSLPCRPSAASARQLEHHARTTAAVLLAASALACSDDNDDPETVALADSASLAPLTSFTIQIPTTVAVSQGVAWITESQFNHYAPFGGDGMPGPFRLLGVPLNGDAVEFIGLPDDYYPEGITSTRSGRLYVGSVNGQGIYTVDEDDFDAVPFITGEDVGGSVFGVTVSTDPQQSMVWACTSSAEGAVSVAGIDVATGTVQVRHEVLPLGDVAPFCNDLIMSPDGALWVTESMGGRLLRIPADSLMTENSAEVWLEAESLRGPEPGSFGANGITLVSGNLYVANTDRRNLWRIDPTLEAPTEDDLVEVALTLDGAEAELVRPDGIAALGSNAILIVENGLGEEGGKRLLQATLDRL